MRAFVSGSAGFVGRHMVAELELRGWEVMENDIAHVDPHWRHDCRTVFRVADRQYVDFDLFVHCAAVIPDRATRDKNALSVVDNLSIDAAAAQFVLQNRPTHTVWFSSSAAYPLEGRGPFQEGDIQLDHMERPDSMYGWGKLNGEVLVRELWGQGLDVHLFRPFSGYGTDQSLNYPFPSFIERAKNHEDPFTIWGDGTQVRDFVHIDDVVNAVFAVMDQDVSGPVNICTGIGTTMNHLAAMICRAAGYLPHFEHVGKADRGVRVGDPDFLNTFYKPQISLEEGIERALKGI